MMAARVGGTVPHSRQASFNVTRRAEYDEDWEDLREQWSLRPGTIYLNHGSFGPPPRAVRQAREGWQLMMDSQPMDFFFRQFEPAWREARRQLARFLGSSDDNLVFVENATVAMNIVAESCLLQPGDEVVLTDHEYGAVRRIWDRRCAAVGATLKIAKLPRRFESSDQVVDCLASQWNKATKLLVVSHITSPTAITLPVESICRRASARGVTVCIDGPHAVAQLPLELDQLGCGYYTASCHKWLSAPFGSGFLYVSPQFQQAVRPLTLSWGRLPPAELPNWTDEFCWSGTRDPSPYFAIPAAIQFLEEVGWNAFRDRTRHLARYARERLVERFSGTPMTSDDPAWHTCMAHVPIPTKEASKLQGALWEKYQMEVPIVEFQQRCFVRVSCHLYTRKTDIDQLVAALADLLG